jgi:hypothetical protein
VVLLAADAFAKLLNEVRSLSAQGPVARMYDVQAAPEWFGIRNLYGAKPAGPQVSMNRNLGRNAKPRPRPTICLAVSMLSTS